MDKIENKVAIVLFCLAILFSAGLEAYDLYLFYAGLQYKNPEVYMAQKLDSPIGALPKGVIEPPEVEEVIFELVEVIEVEPEFVLTDEEIDLLATLTMAEAEGESELGKRLVIDAVLNRMEQKSFPGTVHDVIFQKNQFSCVANGRLSRCRVLDDIRALVLEEIELRTNAEVTFFQLYNYSQYGDPLFKEGSHYFSKTKEE